MQADDDTDREGCRLILDMIAHIERRLGELSVEQFASSKDEIDLTAYRLAVIGETTHRLTPKFRAKHPELNWRAIYALRNYAVHAYLLLSEEKIWNAARHSLPALKAVCEAELSE